MDNVERKDEIKIVKVEVLKRSMKKEQMSNRFL